MDCEGWNHEEIPGSRWIMYGYILTNSWLQSENLQQILLTDETFISVSAASLSVLPTFFKGQVPLPSPLFFFFFGGSIHFLSVVFVKEGKLK